MFVSETFDAQRFADRHRQRVVQQIAKFPVVEVFRNPHRSCLHFVLDRDERHVRQLSKQIFIQAFDLVYFFAFLFRVAASHLACVLARFFKHQVVNRHHDSSRFKFENFLHYRIRFRRYYVYSADQVQHVTRFEAVYRVKDILARLAVIIVPDISVAVRFLSVAVSAVDKEVADKRVIRYVVADIYYYVLQTFGKFVGHAHLRKRAVGLHFNRRLFEYYFDKFGNLYIRYAFKPFVRLDYAFACLAFQQIVEIISEAMSFRVVLRDFIYRRADVRFQVLSAFYDLDDISDQYVAKISRDERQFLHAFFAERQFRNISERNIVNQSFEISRGIFVFENVIDELADFYVLDIVERFVFVEISQAEVLHIVVKRPCPGRVFGMIVDGIAENFVRYSQNYIDGALLFAEQCVEEGFEFKIEHVRKNERKISCRFVSTPGLIVTARTIVGKARDENVHEVADASFREYFVEYFRYDVVAACLNVVRYFEYFVYVKAERVGNHASEIFAAGLLPSGRVLLYIDSQLNQIAYRDFSEAALFDNGNPVVLFDKVDNESYEFDVADFLNERFVGFGDSFRERKDILYRQVVEYAYEVILLLVGGVRFVDIENVVDYFIKVRVEKRGDRSVSLTVTVRPVFSVVIEFKERINIFAENVVDIDRAFFFGRTEEAMNEIFAVLIVYSVDNALNKTEYARFHKSGYAKPERSSVSVVRNVNFFARLDLSRSVRKRKPDYGSDNLAYRKRAVNIGENFSEVNALAGDEIEYDIDDDLEIGVEYRFDDAGNLFQRGEYVFALVVSGYEIRSERFADFKRAELSVDIVSEFFEIFVFNEIFDVIYRRSVPFDELLREFVKFRVGIKDFAVLISERERKNVAETDVFRVPGKSIVYFFGIARNKQTERNVHYFGKSALSGAVEQSPFVFIGVINGVERVADFDFVEYGFKVEVAVFIEARRYLPEP